MTHVLATISTAPVTATISASATDVAIEAAHSPQVQLTDAGLAVRIDAAQLPAPIIVQDVSLRIEAASMPAAVIIGEPGPQGPPGPPGTNPKVQVSASDAAEGYLAEKITAGANITIGVRNAGGAEQLEIAAPGMLGVINTDAPDIGVAQDNAADGYHRRYVADKTLARCRISSASSGAPQIGQLRTVRDAQGDRFEIWLHDERGIAGWQALVSGVILRHRPEENGRKGQLQQRLAGREWWINVDGGWSDYLGLNGSPLVRHYHASMGAYPPPMDSWTWGF